MTLLFTPTQGAIRRVQLAAHFPHMDRVNDCRGVPSSHCFDPAILAAGSPSRYLTSKTYLLTSLEALRKLTSKANSSHPPLTSSINSLNRLESICVSVFCDRLSTPCQLGLETWKSWYLGGCYQAAFFQFILQTSCNQHLKCRWDYWKGKEREK